MTRVMVDPGHGGKDPGAIGRDPFTVRESEVAWTVAALLRSALARQGWTVATTRRQGEYLSPSARANLANGFGAVAFVSVHCNSHTEPDAHGLEVLHYGSAEGSAEGSALAASVLSQLVRRPPVGPPLRNRGLKVRPGLVVLKKTSMPACLVELPFVSNPADLGSTIEAANQIFWAEAIADGLTDWLLG